MCSMENPLILSVSRVILIPTGRDKVRYSPTEEDGKVEEFRPGAGGFEGYSGKHPFGHLTNNLDFGPVIIVTDSDRQWSRPTSRLILFSSIPRTEERLFPSSLW